eukprot:jgi/Mesvir1/11636/Mv00037-RA.2
MVNPVMASSGPALPGAVALTPLRLALASTVVAGVQAGWALQLSLLTPYVQELGVPHAWTSYIWLCGPITGLLVQPYIGVWSDACHHKWGRRRPFIVAGVFIVAMAVFLISGASDIGAALGDPVTARFRPWSAVVFILGFWLLDVANNTIQGPCRALVADLSGDRAELGNAFFSLWMGVGSVLGYAVGATSNWHRWMPFLLTPSCQAACADLKAAFYLALLLLAVTTVITFVTAKEARLARDGTLIEPVEDGDGSITGDVVDSISGDAAGADGTDALAGTGHGGQGTTGGGQSAGSQHEHRAEQGAYLRHQGSGSAGGHGGSPRTPGHHGTDGYMPLHAGQGPGHDSGDDHGHDSCHAQDYPAVVVVAHDSDTHAHPVPLSTPARRRAGWGVGDTGGVDADPHDWHARYTGGLTSPGHHHRLRRHRSWDHDGADGEGLRRALFSGDLGGEHPPHHVASDAPLWRAESLDAPWSSLRRQRAEGRADAMSGGNEAAVAEPPRAPAPGEEERPEDVGVFASLLALSPEMKRLLVVLMLTWVRACVLVRFKVWWKSVPSRHVAWWQGSWSLACVCGRSLVSLGVAEDVSCECRTVETLMLSWFRLCLPVYCERSMLVGIAGAGVWLAAKPQQAVVSGQTLPLMLIVAPPFCPDTGHHPRPLSTHLPLILATTPHPLSTHLPLILATTRAH